MASPELSPFQDEMVESTIAIAHKHKADAETVARVLHGMARAATEAWEELAKEAVTHGMRPQETSRVDRTQDKASQ